jgi:hypothetical protein
VLGVRVSVMSFSLLKKNVGVVVAILIQSYLCEPEMQIAKPTRDEGRTRQFNCPFEMF